MRSKGIHLRTCRIEKGGCGKIFKGSKFATRCPECIKRGKNERKSIQEYHKTILINGNARKNETYEEARERGEKEYIRCGLCGKLYRKRFIRKHISDQHPEEYVVLMGVFYKMIEDGNRNI